MVSSVRHFTARCWNMETWLRWSVQWLLNHFCISYFFSALCFFWSSVQEKSSSIFLVILWLFHIKKHFLIWKMTCIWGWGSGGCHHFFVLKFLPFLTSFTRLLLSHPVLPKFICAFPVVYIPPLLNALHFLQVFLAQRVCQHAFRFTVTAVVLP